METITLDHDISVLYINAESFPNGVLKAHEQLLALIFRERNKSKVLSE
jgi:hypothetical protein